MANKYWPIILGGKLIGQAIVCTSCYQVITQTCHQADTYWESYWNKLYIMMCVSVFLPFWRACLCVCSIYDAFYPALLCLLFCSVFLCVWCFFVWVSRVFVCVFVPCCLCSSIFCFLLYVFKMFVCVLVQFMILATQHCLRTLGALKRLALARQQRYRPRPTL